MKTANAPDYLTHFNFTAAPFSKEIDDGQLWMPPSKQRLVDELTEALVERASILLVGEPGVGKTCVMRALRQRLPQEGFRLTYCHNTTLGRRDFYRQLCTALGLSPKLTAASVFYEITTHVEELAREHIHPVFLIDEAHLLHQDLLDHLHILLNYNWDSEALLSLVLVGLPDLNDRLRLRRNRSLYSRLSYRVRIDPLAPSDTTEYLRMRLERVGCARQLFASDAVTMLHEAAGGMFREIDRIATHALHRAAAQGRELVERDAVLAVVDNRL